MTGFDLPGSALAYDPPRIDPAELLPKADAPPSDRDLIGLVGDPMSCDGPSLPHEFQGLVLKTVSLPRELHGAEGLLAVIETEAGLVLPGLVFRETETEAAVMLPAHPAGPAGGEAYLTLMFDDGPLNIRRQCAPRPISISPPPVQEGAYLRKLENDTALAEETNAVAKALGGPEPFDASWLEARARETEEMRRLYNIAEPQEQWALDMSATVRLTFVAQHGLGADRLRTRQNTAAELHPLNTASDPQQQQTHVTPGTIPMTLAADPNFRGDGLEQIGSKFSEPFFSQAFPTDFDVYKDACPATMDDLEYFMRMHGAGSFAQTRNAKLLYTGASVLGGLSARLAVMSAGGKGAAADIPDKLVNFGAAIYSIHLGYLDGMMPYELTRITAEIDGAILYEDQSDGELRVRDMVLHTKSKGWDAAKAGVDLALAAQGLLGKSAVGELAGGVSGRLGGKLTTDLAKKATQSTEQAQKIVIGRSINAIQAAVDDVIGGVVGYHQGEMMSALYGDLTKSSQKAGKGLKHQECAIPMATNRDAQITLRDPQLVYEYQEFGRYRPVRAGQAQLEIQPNTKDRRYGAHVTYATLPKFTKNVRVPQIQIAREYGDHVIQAGDPVSFGASLVNATSPQTRLEWDLPQSPFLTHSISPDTFGVTATTSRRLENYPGVATARLTGEFLPESDAADRFIEFSVQAGGLWLVPTRSCLSPGMESEVIAFDQRTRERVPARNLVFRTLERGSSVDGQGIVRTDRKMDEVTVIARGVGANAYRGRVTLRGTCDCGTDFFDQRLVTDTAQPGFAAASGRLTREGTAIETLAGALLRNLPTADGYEIFGLNGVFEARVSGTVSGSMRKELPLDVVSTRAEGPYGPTCEILTAGISPLYIGTGMHLSRPGILVPDLSEDLAANRFDLTGMMFDLRELGGPEGYVMATPVGVPRVKLVRFGSEEIVLTISGLFEAEQMRGWGEKARVFVDVSFRSSLQ
ncbi:hypothetical protein [Jannaschia aquimarina]|uniref:hypothetical protein n=1 Tax=Jannaschia aquimarina TaxID=935700 RepID=UPI0011324125|nr:hypothetical protein [Jannaschia aquimarina]